MSDHYRRNEIRRVVDMGPADDEDWFRVRFAGKEMTRTLNLTPKELSDIADMLDANDNA